jgi:hypothetical protein
VRLALNRLRTELEQQELERSADLYAEFYAEDMELQNLTALAGYYFTELNLKATPLSY